MREGDELGAGSGLTRDERRRDPSRVLALTDGVYAIIITLLVLALRMFGLILMATSVTRVGREPNPHRQPQPVLTDAVGSRLVIEEDGCPCR